MINRSPFAVPLFVFLLFAAGIVWCMIPAPAKAIGAAFAAAPLLAVLRAVLSKRRQKSR